jgi:cohesin complex subunit SA-1/2
MLLNLHVLFCSTQPTAADGSPLPTASFALKLDDEVQYRCAGYVQAEIERYIEENNLHSPPDHEEDGDDEGEDENANTRPQKTTKLKKATQVSKAGTTSNTTT